MGDFLSLCKRRISVRHYQAKPVEAEKLTYVMECVRWAPSAVNFQPWQFRVYDTPEERKAIQSCYPREWFVTAPHYILACVDTTQEWVRKSDQVAHGTIDVAIAVEHLCLAAAEQALGTCWVCNFDVAQCRTLLELPAHLVPIAIIPIGYPADSKVGEGKRKPLEEILS